MFIGSRYTYFSLSLRFNLEDICALAVKNIEVNFIFLARFFGIFEVNLEDIVHSL